MKNKEKHSTIKEMKNEGLILCLSASVITILTGSFFFFGDINYGLTSLSASIILFVMGLLVAIKIHSRYGQELLLKINGKTWEMFCSCDYCLALQKQDSVK